MTPPEPQPAAVAGFRVLERIARGGMATVYKAEQVSIGRTVALKVLRPRFAEDKVFVARFQREAHAAARLNHPNIVSAIDVGEADGFHYFAMEYVDGPTAGKLLKQKGPLPWREALGIVAQIARALDHAHAFGMMHLDVKPANIMLDSGGRAKLADFGLARRVEDEDELYNEKKLLFGTPGYMSPEQLTPGAGLDIRSDIFSLGVTLYELLTRKSPFRARERRETVRRVRMGECKLVRELAPDTPEEVEAVLAAMMAVDRDKRYAAPGLLVEDLENVLGGGEPSHALGEAPPPAPDAPEPGALPPDAPPPEDAPGRVRPPGVLWPGLVALALLSALLGASSWLAWGARPATPPPQAKTPAGEAWADAATAIGAAWGEGRFAEAVERCRAFAEQWPATPQALHAAEHEEEIRAAAGRFAEQAAQDAKAAADAGDFDRAAAILSAAREGAGGLAPDTLDAADRHLASARHAAAMRRERRRAEEAAQALARLQERLASLRTKRQHRPALALCEEMLADPALESVHEAVRALREPFARVVAFLDAVARGASLPQAGEVRVGGRPAAVAGARDDALVVAAGGRNWRAELAEVHGEDLFRLAQAGAQGDSAELHAGAAIFFDDAGRPKDALRHAQAVGEAGETLAIAMEARLLYDLAKQATEAEDWTEASRLLARLTGAPRHQPFVQERRAEITALRRQAALSRRFAGMVLVPAGRFAYRPGQTRHVAAFFIDPHEVTVGEYSRFVEAVERHGAARYYEGRLGEQGKDPRPANWEQMLAEPQLPVTGVDWHDAAAYARFAGKRLPTRLEWEKAARGERGFRYPWGDEWKAEPSNTRDNPESPHAPAPVGSFPLDRSPYGCYDMAGNVREWVADEAPRGRRLAMGGHFLSPPGGSALTTSVSRLPNARDQWTGFRCAADAR